MVHCGNRVSDLNFSLLVEEGEHQRFTMDVSRLPPDHASIKGAGYNVVDLASEEDSDIENDLVGLPRVNGVDALAESEEETGDEDEEDNADWEIESIFEDTIEELGDEHLFGGGEHLEYYFIYDALKIELRARCLHSRGSCRFSS